MEEQDKKDKKEIKIQISAKWLKWLGIAVGALIIIAAAVWGFKALFGGLSATEAAKVAETYINNDLMQGQGTVTVKTVKRVGSLYQLAVTYQGREIDSYMTVDGKLFFPTVYEMATSTATSDSSDSSASAAASGEAATKTDKPVVELFVMSYCPYGTQIEKGIIPVVQALGSKIDFKLKFVSYTMHGDKENTENLREYCIDQTQNAKLLTYLTCFLKSSDAASCLKSTGVDESKVTSCMTAAAKKYDVSGTNFSVYADDNEKYSVQGSPTLIINGSAVDSSRDSASLLKTICSGFKTVPSECSTQLSSATPSSGFGDGTTSDSSSASCN